MDHSFETIDCACVIHGSAYSWNYVENLHNMLRRNLTPQVRLHVFTEQQRAVPEPMIKHVLEEWPVVRSGRAWWYKMQLFNTNHVAGPLLYFDLDTVIVGNIDWIWSKPLKYFHAVRDFKYLWSPNSTGINSSVMWWDTRQFADVWNRFASSDLSQIQLEYRGDQDFISHAVLENQRRFFEIDLVKSWRWQCKDGGYDFKKRRHFTPGSGTHVDPATKIMIFHGSPKPHQVQDLAILQHWK